ncbi:acetoin utilization protein AcuA [Scopulibacillus darangshiensis]|uniref:Acetoin utilization protein AcuA n=1 Tax=Scopulibacillus darangshiensis TaxID=442528 RepID=A0A4R2PAF4_9BACL|nr:GNAT family N-acetyltransferase [Scopulibacillus darangshiensis]TCP32043.1 acetoin utilization protein AcuA [Scopulibacillus darangshiensis]
MLYSKIYNAAELKTPKAKLIVEGPVSAERLTSYRFHEDLTAFRPPEEQFKAIMEIAKLPEGRIIIASDHQTIVGYVTFLYPDPLERWSEGANPFLMELGAIEIIPEYRKYKVGKNLLQISMMDDFMDNYIIITTEYYWHWDLKGTGLTVWEYRKVMEKVMQAGGLEVFATDDPEISSHPANCLMVRIGKHVPRDAVEAFDLLRFKNKYMY